MSFSKSQGKKQEGSAHNGGHQQKQQKYAHQNRIQKKKEKR